MDGTRSVIGTVLAIIHCVGADGTHVIDARGDGADGIVVDLAHGMQIDEEIDAVVPDVEGGVFR